MKTGTTTRSNFNNQRDNLQIYGASMRAQLDFDVACPSVSIQPRRPSPRRRCPAPRWWMSFSEEGAAMAGRLGAAAGSIPASGLRPDDLIVGDVELRRAQERMQEIDVLVPSLRHRLGQLLRWLTDAHARFAPRGLVPIHGSPHPNQWLCNDDRLGLVDFDRLSLGDPELDVATFVAEVDFERHGASADINRAFIAGYSERYGPLDPVRLSTYLAHKRLAKVHRTARSIRPGSDGRGAAHLERAFEAVS